jgi:erythrocyte band 7 integral membrane protein
LKDAADVIMQSPTALQLRYLQTLTTIASEKNSTIVFPIPVMKMNGINMNSYLETQL